VSNVEDIEPVDCLATRVWGGTHWHYPHIERMVSEMKTMRKTITDHAAELARVEASNALLRAECEAWREFGAACDRDFDRGYDGPSGIEDAVATLKEARAATDAAGILKGVE